MEENSITPEDVAMLETFRQKYAYAANMQEATEYLTTEDVHELLGTGRSELSFDTAYLDDWLTTQGYANHMVEMTRYWLFKID